MPDELPDDAAATPPVAPPRRTAAGAGRWAPPSPEHLQRLLPQYEVIEMLGHGGMGAVYKARQISLDRLVAIKILPPEILDDEDANFVERFKNEARTMARMNHPGIVAVHDFGQTPEGQLYFVMEFVDGTDVAKMLLSQGRLSADYALAVTAHVCDALQYAHTHGVIHRDIKPANVLINMEGQVKVADFGLAKGKDAAPGTGLTRTDMTMGTPDFVAPEALVAGMEADHRADLYALGVMLYNMLTGEIPRGRFKPASEKAGCDPRFDAIINKAMESERAERYQTALNLRRDLDVILTTPVVQAGDRKGSAAIPGRAAQQGIARKPVARGPGQAPAQSAAARGGMQPRRSSAGKVAAVLAVTTIIAAGVIFMLKKPAGETPDKGQTDPVAGSPATPPAASGTPADSAPRSDEQVRRAESGNVSPAAPPGIGARTEAWTDWLAGVRNGGAAPTGYALEADGLRSMAASGSAIAICGGAPMHQCALRVTFVPSASLGRSGTVQYVPGLYLRRSGHPGSLKQYNGAVVASSKKVVLSVMDQTAKFQQNHAADLPPGFDVGKEFTMELRAEDDVISLILDGKKLSSIHDTRIREGVPAFYAPAGYLVKKVELLNLDADAPAAPAKPAAAGSTLAKPEARETSTIPATLFAQYTAALARNRDAAGAADKSAYEAELARLKSDATIPANDDAGIPDSLKKLRQILRQEIAKQK